MKTHFKDYKTKMMKEQEEISRQTTPVSFQPEALSATSKGVFVKTKVLTEKSLIVAREEAEVQSGFLFNFKDPTAVVQDNLASKVNSMKLSQ